MDQTNQPTQTNNPIANDYLVTKQVNPSTLPQNQVKNDLDNLLKAEKVLSPKKGVSSLSQPLPEKKERDFRPNTDTPQVLTALQVKNPFTGE